MKIKSKIENEMRMSSSEEMKIKARETRKREKYSEKVNMWSRNESRESREWGGEIEEMKGNEPEWNERVVRISEITVE
jgi:hypothetical protein